MKSSMCMIGVALLLTGCPDDTNRQSEAAAPRAVPSASPAEADAPVAGTRAAAGGQALTGSVSGLSGVITGFDVRRTATETIVDLAADVLFDFDAATLSAEAPSRLAKAAELIRQAGGGAVTVVGHTDAKGDDAYNQKLSLARADAVAKWLSSSGGVPIDRLKTQGRGETEPVAPNTDPMGKDDPSGRARNRRVSLTIPN
jgi:outer membrane protein OmpA-like peptidoglycan-associated protein